MNSALQVHRNSLNSCPTETLNVRSVFSHSTLLRTDDPGTENPGVAASVFTRIAVGPAIRNDDGRLPDRDRQARPVLRSITAEGGRLPYFERQASRRAITRR